MRPLIAMLLIGSVLFGQTELHQLARMPQLVEHFLEHKAEQPGTTLFGFIALHYFSGDVQDEDFAADEELPFRSHDDHAMFSATKDLFHGPEAVVTFHYPVLPLSPACPSSALSLGERTDVWQPPKQA